MFSFWFSLMLLNFLLFSSTIPSKIMFSDCRRGCGWNVVCSCHCCILKVQNIGAVKDFWTLYGHTWISRQQPWLLTCDCGFHVILVWNLRVWVYFLGPCIVCIDCMQPSFSGMCFTWYPMCTLWWEWALVLPMWMPSDCNRGVRCEFDYIGNVVCWYK